MYDLASDVRITASSTEEYMYIRRYLSLKVCNHFQGFTSASCIITNGNCPGGGTWVFRGAHTFVIKIKKYP